MRKREIKKTVISYQEDQVKKEEARERERSREKKERVEVVDASSRRARLEMMKKRRRDEEQLKGNQEMEGEPVIRIEPNLPKVQPINSITREDKDKVKLQQQNPSNKPAQNKQKSMQSEDQSEGSNQQQRVLLKPVYISKQNREQEPTSTKYKQQQRKKKAIRYTTKLLLLENAKDKQQSDEEIVHSSDEEKDNSTMPDDDDTKGQEYQYELWKVRELKRIRRDREQRRKIEMEKAQIERRRKMNNEEILLENKVMGSDATDNATETKYVYLQKYYHKGAFYQDSQDPIFKRDYNLPTPLQMQDKSMLPEILQRRQGNFGKKGQSKYKHLTAEDTTNFDPQFRPDQSIMASWKKKMAGYKGSGGSNI